MEKGQMLDVEARRFERGEAEGLVRAVARAQTRTGPKAAHVFPLEADASKDNDPEERPRRGAGPAA